jgi:hypothetical protein
MWMPARQITASSATAAPVVSTQPWLATTLSPSSSLTPGYPLVPQSCVLLLYTRSVAQRRLSAATSRAAPFALMAPWTWEKAITHRRCISLRGSSTLCTYLKVCAMCSVGMGRMPRCVATMHVSQLCTPPAAAAAVPCVHLRTYHDRCQRPDLLVGIALLFVWEKLQRKWNGACASMFFRAIAPVLWLCSVPP